MKPRELLAVVIEPLVQQPVLGQSTEAEDLRSLVDTPLELFASVAAVQGVQVVPYHFFISEVAGARVDQCDGDHRVASQPQRF